MIYKAIYVAIAFLALFCLVAWKVIRFPFIAVAWALVAIEAWRESKTEAEYHEICK